MYEYLNDTEKYLEYSQVLETWRMIREGNLEVNSNETTWIDFSLYVLCVCPVVVFFYFGVVSMARIRVYAQSARQTTMTTIRLQYKCMTFWFLFV